MVSVAFSAVAPSLGLAGAGISAGAAVAGAGLGLLAAYVDQQFLFPAMFGKRDTKPVSLEGFQISTTDPGAPRWEVYGSRAWVPCHYLWSLNIRDETSSSGGKGSDSRPFTHTVRADVGLAVADGPVSDIDTLYADERPFWSRQFNQGVLEDYRWAIEAGSGGTAGMLVLTCESVDQQDFAGLFAAEDVVRLENASPIGLNGFYRVDAITPHSGTTPASLVLDPLEGQTPAAGTAGSAVSPARLRRMDQAGASTEFVCQSNVGAGNVAVIINASNATALADYESMFETQERRDRRWVVGGLYRVRGWPGSENVLLRLTSARAFPNNPPTTPQQGQLLFVIVQGTTGANTSPGVSPPVVVYRSDDEALAFYDEQQEWNQYPGSQDQPQDPLLAALRPDAPAHRGIAHLSIANWNLGPHGNIFPRVTALARARLGEEVSVAIQRICLRTMTEAQCDVSLMRPRQLQGYSIPGGLASGAALQPLLTFFGVAVQDRGGVLTFLDERDLPVVVVATRHLNARPSTQASQSRGFVANRVDPDDVHERVLIRYIEPTGGRNEAEGSGRRAPGDPSRGRRDTIEIDLKPLVAWPYDVKRRARELDRRIRLETYRGQVSLPPGYMDVLPGTILTFASNNDQEEDLPAGATIAYDTELRDIVPGSVALQVRFTNGQVATLLDDENGALEGLPAGIIASVNTIDYEAGRIDLTCSVDLDDTLVPALTYRYEKQWFMRASKALLSGFDFSLQCDVVTTSTDDPLPPLPREIPGGLGGALAGATPVYETEVIDVPPLYVGQNSNVLIYFGITPTPGSVWRGATIYQSPNGTDLWSAVSQAGSPTPMGTVPVSTLPDAASANPAVIDWTTEVTVDLPNGETLDSATTEQIALGQNWALIGDEIVGFHEAEALAGTEWVLRGLVRALRHTHAAIDTHTDGERFVLLTAIGGLHGAVFEPVGGYAAANRTYYFRVVPAGASVDSVETISQLIVGRSALVAPPLLEASMITQSVGSHIDITWERRSYGQTTLFGALPLPPGEFERYEVVAFDHAEYLAEVGDIGVDAAIAAAARRRWIVGDQSMGTPLVDREVVYTNAEMEGSDGFVLGTDAIGFVVYQMGAAGRSERSGIVVMTPTATPLEV